MEIARFYATWFHGKQSMSTTKPVSRTRGIQTHAQYLRFFSSSGRPGRHGWVGILVLLFYIWLMDPTCMDQGALQFVSTFLSLLLKLLKVN